ncbi:MAG: hypothetical protein GVY08_07105 [Bacteroidetes bacterium]|nr:hypothetical protein [Bacteroidota bacterium]
MTSTNHANNSWPELPSMNEWADTQSTVHMWTQIVGKVRLELSPWVNHSWGSVLYVSPVGLTTSAIPYEGSTFDIEFDFVKHRLIIRSSGKESNSFELKPMTVAEFYEKIMADLHELGIKVSILARPVEVEEAIPFTDDTKHNSYDADAIHRYWRALVQIDRVFSEFRSGFVGKSSPSHFFWGAFDLAVTRFSGRPAPKHPGGAPNCADWVMEEAYSRELSSAGFWPGTGVGEPAFYSYAYPEPNGYRDFSVKPKEAYYHTELGEYLLLYHDVQSSSHPDATLMEFLQSTYEAAATNGDWNRDALEVNAVNSQ